MRTAAIIVLAFAAASCTTAQLDLPEAAYDVHGANPRVWNRPIAFGPYRTERVDEGTRRSWLANLSGLQIGKADQGYHLQLNDVAVECHTRELAVGVAGVFVDPTLGRSPLLVCGYDLAGARAVLTLSRTGRPEPSLRGTLRHADGSALEVRSLHRGSGSAIPSSDPWGYEIVSGGAQVAIVETINRGRVWIDPAAEEHDRLAAVAASLLLFRDPDAGSD